MVTSRLLEAFLACPVKCHLLSEGEVPAGTEYSAWAAGREESYQLEGVRKLTSQETGPGILEFPDPGEPVMLLVRGSNAEVVYEAMPAGSYGKTIGRALVPFVDDGNPNLFSWPPNSNSHIKLESGREVFSISVIKVGKSIAGEEVSLVIKPPVSFKSHAPNHGWLWWFAWWPLYDFTVGGLWRCSSMEIETA